MKKYSILAAALVLTLTVFTGCGCRRQEPETVPPTRETVMPTIPPTTAETVPDITDMIPSETDFTETVPNGTETDGTVNDDATTDSTGTAGEGRSRSRSMG